MLRATLVLLVLCSAVFNPASFAQLQLQEMTPRHGPAGVNVVLHGEFPEGAAIIRINGVNAPIAARDATAIRFVVPESASSGPVEVILGDEGHFFRDVFTVTRLLPVRLAAPLDPARYAVGSIIADALGNGPIFMTPVAKGEATVIAATAGENDPVLSAVVTDVDQEVTLDARTTAVSFLMSAPAAFSADTRETARRIAFFAADPAFNQLVSAINTEVAAGRDYIEHPAVEAAALTLLTRFYDQYEPGAPTAQPASPGQGGLQALGTEDFVNGVFNLAAGYPRDLEAPGYEKLRRLVAKSSPVRINERGIPVIPVKLEPGAIAVGPLEVKVASLDYIATLYELDPNDPALNTPAKLQALRGSFSTVYPRISQQAISRVQIKAKPAGRVLDLPDLVADEAFQFLSSAMVGADALEVPADRSGIYIARAFNGARFPPQADLIRQLPGGRREANVAFALNFLMALNDVGGIIGKGKSIAGDDCFNKYMISQLFSIMNAVEREAAANTLSAEVIGRLFLHMAKSHFKDYILKCIILDSSRRGISGFAKISVKGVGTAGKVASFFKLAERINALGNLIGSLSPGEQRVWSAQAIEDTIIVVGNPWQPRLTGFYPRDGYRGAIVRIEGERFSRLTNENIVTFGILSTDPLNPSVPARAEVLAATENSLVVRVPEEASTGLISVSVAAHGTASSVDLPDPFKQFVVFDDPEITAVEPNSPEAGGVVLIRGRNFARPQDIQHIVFPTGSPLPVLGTREFVPLRVPNSRDPVTVRVRVQGRLSNPITFTPTVPTLPTSGSAITVTSQADNTAADGHITLREAMILAKGGIRALGRDLTSPPDPRPIGVSYETDLIKVSGGAGPGVASADSITIAVTNVLVSGPLPTIEAHDSISGASFNSIIDGRGGQFDCFVATNAHSISITLAGIKGFSGSAIRLEGTSRSRIQVNKIEACGVGVLMSGVTTANFIRSTSVERCIGAGFLLQDNSLGHLFEGCSAIGNEVGFHLKGPGVMFTEAELGMSANENRTFGILIEEGSILNRFAILNQVSSNGLGGIRIGANSSHNMVGSFAFGARIYDNGGPGVWISSGSNALHNIIIGGNRGDGILIEGAEARGITMSGIISGHEHRFGGGALRPNHGSGLHIRNGASDIVVGAANGDHAGLFPGISGELGANAFGGNLEHGIWIQGPGTRDVRVNWTMVGVPTDSSSPAAPNKKHGIAITDKASHVTIGSHRLGTVVTGNHTNGAGIYLEQAISNHIFGVQLGRDGFLGGRGREGGNKYGLWISTGSYGNRIGARGERHVTGDFANERLYDPRNHIYSNLEAGILIEAGGDPTRTIREGELPSGGNVIVNNLIGANIDNWENQVGILIRQGAVVNRIGGRTRADRNLITGSVRAGILMDNARISRPHLANRIIGNLISNGIRAANPTDPLVGRTDGVGIAILGGGGHIIGGNHSGETNELRDNFLAVHLINTSSNQIVSAEVERNRRGGFVALNSSHNRLGPDNEFVSNGGAGFYGAITVKHGEGNRIVGNRIGLQQHMTAVSVVDGNNPHGIALLDSRNNRVGDFGAPNIIVGSASNGVYIAGSGSVGNHVARNYIGYSPIPGQSTSGNRQSGILLSDGASMNMIGGELPARVLNGFVPTLAPNYIRVNVQDGVRVDGAATKGNTIIYNAIYDHTAGLAIQNQRGGNDELPPPFFTTSDGTHFEGEVNRARVPDGSRVQFYSDTGDEGRIYLGETFVAGGRFKHALPPAGSRINATVTHAITGDTSEFTPLSIRPRVASLSIARVPNEPTQTPAAPGADAVAAALRLVAEGDLMRVTTLTVRSSGTADEALPGATYSLHRDTDGNRIFTEADLRFAGPITIRTNNANLTFSPLSATVDPAGAETWFLIVKSSTNTPSAETFQFDMPGDTFMGSYAVSSGEAVVETAAYPIVSDTVIVQSGGSATQRVLIGRDADGRVSLDWTTGTLEESATLDGQWRAVPNATAPFKIIPAARQNFYRVRE